ncbi:MAG: discoidin domain-containing protein [Planctomycetota bacterium]|nr:discoidin domain-containing protein [Planctomycetota bacterium]
MLVNRIGWYAIGTYAFLLAAAGCGDDIATRPPGARGGRALVAAISPKAQWRATSATMSEPEAAIDSRLQSAAVGPSVPKAELLIDLGKPCLFNRVILDHGTNDDEAYPRQVALQTSMDGRVFYTRKTGLGTRWRTNFSLITPTTARYVRLEVIKAGTGSWRIAEVTLE